MAGDRFRKANAAYERWLREQLRGRIVGADLRAKWEKMASGAFPFLRATYWRWAETILTVCPELAKAPRTLAIGDIHLENFGVWRDDDGRLVWGVNDFDEAAVMPYPLDLVRLATSAALASSAQSHNSVCAAIIEGYRNGLKKPRPFALDEEHRWLRKLLVVSETERAGFWDKIARLRTGAPPRRYRRAIEGALPDGAEVRRFCRRQAGTGSLGRPRWVGVTEWNGGKVVREAKALVPSGWTRAHGGGRKLRVQDIANGRYRSPDPWYAADNSVVVRRLSPNSRKIEVDKEAGVLLSPLMLRAMGHELANIHLGASGRRRAIERDLNSRKSSWLHDATRAAEKSVRTEFAEWRRFHRKR